MELKKKMTSEETKQTPLARLVLFMFCLAIAGSVVAGVHYVVIDIPAQQQIAEKPPENGSMHDECNSICNRYGFMSIMCIQCNNPAPH